MQTYDLLNIMYHGFTGLCQYMLKKYPEHLISPLRVNGSAIETVFSSLRYIAGGHLSSTNYSTTIGSFLTQKDTSSHSNIHPNAEKEYRTTSLSIVN